MFDRGIVRVSAQVDEPRGGREGGRRCDVQQAAWTRYPWLPRRVAWTPRWATSTLVWFSGRDLARRRTGVHQIR
jgi:hypothetical protein